MLDAFLEEVRPAVVVLAAFTVLTGGAYPLLVTGIARIAFPSQAEGGLVVSHGNVIGSQQIAQSFTTERYFWPRPSACGYDAAASSGSNLAPSNPALVDAVKARIATLRASDPDNVTPIPEDIVLSSGSGLDPDISLAAALWQAPRIARARGIGVARVQSLIRAIADRPTMGILGEERVNVLRLNRALDDLQ